MKNLSFSKLLASAALLLGAATAQAQQGLPVVLPPANLPPYNARVLFQPDFLNQTPPSTRTAGGKPGATYWQNAADYQINASLDDKAARITSRLAFIW